MKIIFNTWSGAFFNLGGGEVQLLNTKSALEAKGHVIEFYNQWHPQKDLDLLHQFSIQYGVNYVVDAYKQMDKKVALSTILWGEFTQSDHMYWQIRDLLFKADILFTNSEIESNRISKQFDVGLDKFHKTRNAITKEYFTLGNPELFYKKYGLSGEFVLSVANIDRRKNTHQLVSVCKNLGLQLVIIGAVRDQEYFESFKETYSDVHYLGPIYDVTMLKSAYRACRVFALPSLCETPGIAALEAASQGASLVITDQGCAQEYLTHYAHYVSPYSYDSIKNGLLEAMDTQVSDDQAEFICSQFTWEQTALDIQRGYSKIL
jgi:glycosyltransferase involved in cell wall biosynthesis